MNAKTDNPTILNATIIDDVTEGSSAQSFARAQGYFISFLIHNRRAVFEFRQKYFPGVIKPFETMEDAFDWLVGQGKGCEQIRRMEILIGANSIGTKSNPDLSQAEYLGEPEALYLQVFSSRKGDEKLLPVTKGAVHDLYVICRDIYHNHGIMEPFAAAYVLMGRVMEQPPVMRAKNSKLVSGTYFPHTNTAPQAPIVITNPAVTNDEMIEFFQPLRTHVWKSKAFDSSRSVQFSEKEADIIAFLMDSEQLVMGWKEKLEAIRREYPHHEFTSVDALRMAWARAIRKLGNL